MEIRSTCVLNTFQQIYRSILPCAAAFYGIRGSSTRTNIRRICNNTFALIVYVSFMHRPLGHMLASCIHIRPRCTQRSRLYAVAHIFYFVLCTRNPRQRSKLEICQRFEAWPPRHPRGMYSREQFSPENRSGAVRECHVSPPATVEILLFFSFFGEWKSQVVSKFHKLV